MPLVLVKLVQWRRMGLKQMNTTLFDLSQKKEVIQLYTQVFGDSEGVAEGQIIGELVSNMIETTKPEDLIGCVVVDDEAIVGCIFFSRMIVPSGQSTFILSPVAVSTGVQKSGIGQKLIQFGLNYLKTQGVELAFTYGDPAYYSKVGFEQISEDVVQAPCPLSQPIGWLAQSLNNDTIQPMKGKAQCVEALSDPIYW